MTNNHHSIYPQKLNQEFIDIIANLAQIENKIKTCIKKQENELDNLSRECQDGIERSQKSEVRSQKSEVGVER
ncbi:MAG: hypothetical protein ACRC1Z_13750 [Waterburya sp.]